jgi:hypothetical protein
MTTDGMSALAVALRELHERASRPSTREIAARAVRATGGTVSHVAVHSMLSGNNVPRWDNLQAVVIALGGDPMEFRRLWLDASAPVTGITPAEERKKIWLSDKEYMFADEVTPPVDADLAGGGREFRVAGNLENDRKYSVAEFGEHGLEVRIGGLERWQAYAIVAILHPPFEE